MSYDEAQPHPCWGYTRGGCAIRAMRVETLPGRLRVGGNIISGTRSSPLVFPGISFEFLVSDIPWPVFTL